MPDETMSDKRVRELLTNEERRNRAPGQLFYAGDDRLIELLQARLATARQERDEAVAKWDTFRQQNNVCVSHRIAAEMERDEARAEHDQLRATVEASERDVDGALDQRDELKARVAELEGERNLALLRIEGLTIRVRQLEIGHDEWRTLARRSNDTRDQAEARVAELEAGGRKLRAAVTARAAELVLLSEIDYKRHDGCVSRMEVVAVAKALHQDVRETDDA